MTASITFSGLPGCTNPNDYITRHGERLELPGEHFTVSVVIPDSGERGRVSRSDAAGKGRRSRRYRPTNSAARCCASAALPPLPKKMALWPDLYAETKAAAAASSAGRQSSTKRP